MYDITIFYVLIALIGNVVASNQLPEKSCGAEQNLNKNAARHGNEKGGHSNDATLKEIKSLLECINAKLDKLSNVSSTPSHTLSSLNSNANERNPESANAHKENRKENPFVAHKKPKWGHWTEWSPCSATCGKGRHIRWRHCEFDCEEADTELNERMCQLPACAPGKIFGIPV